MPGIHFYSIGHHIAMFNEDIFNCLVGMKRAGVGVEGYIFKCYFQETAKLRRNVYLWEDSRPDAHYRINIS